MRSAILLFPLAICVCAAGPSRSADVPPSPDQEIGRHFQINGSELPAPYAEKASSNSSDTTERGDRKPIVPDGFSASLFADGLRNPRQMLVLADGGVLVADQSAGTVLLLRDADRDGAAETRSTVAQDFSQPYGLAIATAGSRKGEVLVSDARGIWSLPWKPGEAALPPQAPLAASPVTHQGVFGRGGGHSTRSLAVDPRDGRMFVGVGSSSNVAIEAEPRATLQVFDADGRNQRTFASGTRNPMGVGFNPATGALWAVVQERDGLGDHLVPDYFAAIRDGGFYGWPYAYTGGKPMPGFADKAPDKVAATVMPDLLFEAHSSSMDFVFYGGDQFPARYRGGAFVALRGSWNRGEPTGYKVVHVPFKDGRPSGGYDNFATGFWVGGKGNAVVWGRPSSVAELPDGSLLIGDDTGGTIWRVTYTGS